MSALERFLGLVPTNGDNVRVLDGGRVAACCAAWAGFCFGAQSMFVEPIGSMEDCLIGSETGEFFARVARPILAGIVLRGETGSARRSVGRTGNLPG